MKKMFVYIAFLYSCISGNAFAQGIMPTRTPEELRELFGYCEKPELMKKLKFSSEMSDKVGEIDYWARLQQISIDANTNAVYATAGELEEEVIKKYKAIRLSDDQLKGLIDFKRARLTNENFCPAITINHYDSFDTLSPLRALQMYKSKYRKILIDQIGINGRQSDMLLETEVWKQKESLSLFKMPIADFNRIRKTVAMYTERDKRYKALGLSDEQINLVIEFFNTHQI